MYAGVEWANPVCGVDCRILGAASVQSVIAGIGFIGVFIGPTLPAVGYRLVQEWLSNGSDAPNSDMVEHTE